VRVVVSAVAEWAEEAQSEILLPLLRDQDDSVGLRMTNGAAKLRTGFLTTLGMTNKRRRLGTGFLASLGMTTKGTG
jgi:hypothetical protein